MVFCVIPAFNEEKSINKVVFTMLSFVDRVVVVDDASSDKTLDVLGKIITHGRLKVLSHSINRGQGAALQTGNEYALSQGADIIVHFDADGQFLPAEALSLIRLVENNEADVVLGSRFLGNKSKIPFFKAKIILPLAGAVNYILGVRGLTDPQSGFRVMSRAATEKLKITQDRMAHCSEILEKIFSNRLRVKEAPITVFYPEYGQRFGGGLKILKELIIGKIIG